MTAPAIIIFTGPTLSAADGAEHLDATWLPPVAQGDVYAAARRRPWGIGIIDGYFERIPSVWHKEILWALHRGVHVFGAASMGALRAAELDAYGMEGVGRTYEAYRDGDLEDDDEVAVTHAPAEFGYRAASEAMVNIRATLTAARAADVVDDEQADHLLSAAKVRHYAERRWADILGDAATLLGESRRLELEQWVSANRIDQKRADAVAMLRHIAARQASDPGPKVVTFTFQSTDSWHQVRAQVDDREPGHGAGADTELPDAALEELRLLGADLLHHRERALSRLLALELAERIDIQPDAEDIKAARQTLRARHGLDSDAGLEAWAETQALSPADLERLLKEEARAARIERIAGVVLPTYRRDWLRLEGRYGALLGRARDKQRVLAAARIDPPTPADAGLTESSIWTWYFCDHLDREVPDNVGRWAHAHDFESEQELRLAALRERCYQQLVAGDSE